MMAELSRRAEIRLGFRCNARCGFCYYQDRLEIPKEEEPKAIDLERRLRLLRRLGASEVEFTGGEPTLRSELPELIRLSRDLGFVNISMITNGLKAARFGYAEKLVEAGLNDVLLSLHGHEPDLHDEHTGITGSHKAAIQALNNFKKLGVRVRTSATITGRNVKWTKLLLKQSIDLGSASVHLAVFSPASVAEASHARFYVRYTDAAAAIKGAIDELKQYLPPLSVKYIPFCVMRGYEQYVMNFYQQSYDPDDWNYYFSNRIRRADKVISGFLFDLLSVCAAPFSGNFRHAKKHGGLGLKVQGLSKCIELVRKKRISACKACRYDRVCDHVWRDYLKRFGAYEFEPVLGDKINDPVWCYLMATTRPAGEQLNKGAVTRNKTQLIHTINV